MARRTRTLFIVTATLTLAASLVAGTASADIPPPDTISCRGHQVGDTCTLRSGAEGTCQKETCYRARPDGTKAYDCLKCRATEGDRGGIKDTSLSTRTLGGLALGVSVLGLGLMFARRLDPHARSLTVGSQRETDPEPQPSPDR